MRGSKLPPRQSLGVPYANLCLTLAVGTSCLTNKHCCKVGLDAVLGNPSINDNDRLLVVLESVCYLQTGSDLAVDILLLP
jgi:hypothetical protein